MINFSVIGPPIAQPRHKIKGKARWIQKRKDGSEHPIHAWKELIVLACYKNVQRPLITGPIQLDYVFKMARPNDHYKVRGGKITAELKPWAEDMMWHYVKPDEDNLVKALKDAITLSESIWGDDCQVCYGTQRAKRWVEEGEEPGVNVWIRPL